MTALVEQFRSLVLYVSVILLAVTTLAVFFLALRRNDVFERLQEAWRTATERGPYQSRISSVLVWLCVVPLVCVLVVRGATKNGGGTNEPPGRMGRQIPTEAVVAEDITRGYRVSVEGEAAILPMPSGAVTNDLLCRRGGFDWAFRVAPEGWRFPYRDGCLTGVTVFARGEVRPDVGTLYFPVPITNGVSLLPEARWNLLTNGGASVFSHAVTENGSLILDWHNALVGRDVNCPTNLQMELRADGGFAWRTDDGAQFYLPVLPFDWDGDGLENSVDPDPLVAHPFDCHGANAEWYAVVCSNVFTLAEDPGMESIVLPNDEEVFFATNVNNCAYYFVEVVAEQGPAPIYFVANRDSWLGSPAVVARGGETNHVPLLIGVEYTVTSTVPITVSVLDADYAEVTMNDVNNYTVKWPLEFEFVEELGGESRFYTVEVKPFDPGGEFVWGATDSGGARLVSAQGGGACACWFGLGYSVSSGCSDCGCGGCSATGYFLSDGTRFEFSGGSCGCSDDDHEEEDEGHGVTTNMNFASSVSLTMDNSVIVFEDEYSNDSDDTVPRRSTWTCVTVEFAAGNSDASCSIKLIGGASRVAMHENSRGGPVCTSRRYNLKKNRTVTKTFHIEGVRPSGGTGDIQIQAEISGGGSGSDSANLTVYKVEVEPLSYVFVEDLVHRHELGVGEKVTLRVMPDANYTVVPSLGSMDQGIHVAPFTESSYSLDFMISGTSFSTPLSTFAPKKCIVRGVSEFVGYYIASNQAGAVSMKLDLALTPANVSFSEIETQEVPSMDSIHSGYFDNALWQPYWYHSDKVGAGEWIPGGFHPNDDVAFGLSCPQPWSSGVLIWYIPLAWRPQGDTTVAGTVFDNITQEFSITSDGVFVLKKFNHAIRRVRNETPQLFRSP